MSIMCNAASAAVVNTESFRILSKVDDSIMIQGVENAKSHYKGLKTNARTLDPSNP
jgi:phosphatidate phosphatase APP1